MGFYSSDFWAPNFKLAVGIWYHIVFTFVCILLCEVSSTATATPLSSVRRMSTDCSATELSTAEAMLVGDVES